MSQTYNLTVTGLSQSREDWGEREQLTSFGLTRIYCHCMGCGFKGLLSWTGYIFNYSVFTIVLFSTGSRFVESSSTCIPPPWPGPKLKIVAQQKSGSPGYPKKYYRCLLAPNISNTGPPTSKLLVSALHIPVNSLSPNVNMHILLSDPHKLLGELDETSRHFILGDHFLHSYDPYVWSSSDIVRKQYWSLKGYYYHVHVVSLHLSG